MSDFYEDTVMPNARTSEIVVQQFDDEILVYDMLSNKAHNLNPTSATVWEKCDGKTSIVNVVKTLEIEINAKLDKEFVLVALKGLAEVNLLEDKWNLSVFPKLSRRNILRRYALPALSIPVIMSLVTPISAQMGSCLGTGQTGCNITPCCPNNTCQAVVGPGGIITNLCVSTP